MNTPPNNALGGHLQPQHYNSLRNLGGASFFALITIQSASAVWITNFTSLTTGPGGSASGVWRDVTTSNTGAGTDTGFVVNLTTTGDVKPISDPTHPSNLSEGFPWRDIGAGETVNGITTPFPVSLPFAPQVNGDFPNIETDGNATSIVTFNFGALITNPVLSFSDVDTQTTMVFSQSFTVLTSTGNLTHTGNNIGSAGAGSSATDAAIFGEESAGSIQFTGTFSQLQFTINNTGPDPDDDDDRTGFVVSTVSAPQEIPEPAPWLLGSAGLLFLVMRRRK
ncbi:hypothetical protein NT6N_30670 [Oceaniferula spumae]|uniref:PEP-CTERM sorting domain-containing protein n=1 Tax=Oceaniferula spumae TaxID=2979115 RepID=A0AAT9FQ54_9BACT